MSHCLGIGRDMSLFSRLFKHKKENALINKRTKQMGISEAEQLYKKYNCATFHMAREDYPNYELFRKLKINDTLLKKWQDEVLEEHFENLKRSGELGYFYKLLDLIEGHTDRNRLNVFIESLDYIDFNIEKSYCGNIMVDMCPEKISLILAESIMSGYIVTTRQGLLFWSFDFGTKEQFEILKNKAITYLNVETDNKDLQERKMRDIKNFNHILKVLNIEK